MVGKTERVGDSRFSLGKLLCLSKIVTTSFVTYVTAGLGGLIQNYFWKHVVNWDKYINLLICLNSCSLSVLEPDFLIPGDLSSRLCFPLESPRSPHKFCWLPVGWIAGLHTTALSKGSPQPAAPPFLLLALIGNGIVQKKQSSETKQPFLLSWLLCLISAVGQENRMGGWERPNKNRS